MGHKLLNILIKTAFIALISVYVLMAEGCVPQHEDIDYTQFYWPSKPLTTRLRMLDIVYTDADIRKEDAVSLMFGETASFSFKKPHDVEVSSTGDIYATDSYKGGVYMMNRENGAFKIIQRPGGWKQPVGLALDESMNMLAVSDYNEIVFIDTQSERLTKIIRDKDIQKAGGLAFDPANRFLYVVDTKGSAVYKYDYSGKRIAEIASLGTGEGNVFYPSDVEVDKDGRVFVVDTMNWRINIYEKDGSFLRAFGNHGSTPGEFNRPKGIAISKDGVLAITDADLGFFILMNDMGQMYAYNGGLGTNIHQFTTPQGIEIDSQDRIYVMDQTNKRMKIFQMYTDRYYKEHPEELGDTSADGDKEEQPAVESEQPATDEPAAEGEQPATDEGTATDQETPQ